MQNKIDQLLSNDLRLSDNDIIDIFVEAINSILVEKKYNFNLERHKEYFVKNGTTEGCGCEYCKLRHKLRNINIRIHRDDKWLEKMWDALTKDERIREKEKIDNLKSISNSVKEYKNLVKKELNIKKICQ